MKRALLLILTNLAILVMLSITCAVLGVNRYLTATGLNLGTLLVFCAVMGFGGAFVSLLISKPMAKWSTGAQVISGQENAEYQWLVAVVARLAHRAGIAMPEVAVYQGEPNAFATGASKNKALVAVSTGLLQSMTRTEVEAVLAHEIAHAASSDMTGLTLVQGVVNTFVMFLARVIGTAVDRGVLRNDGNSPGIAYSVTVIVMDLVLGVLASMLVAAYSRHREFEADAGAARLLGSPAPMIQALQCLLRAQGTNDCSLPRGLRAFGIAATPRMLSLFATHPLLETRIAALQQYRA